MRIDNEIREKRTREMGMGKREIPASKERGDIEDDEGESDSDEDNFHHSQPSNAVNREVPDFVHFQVDTLFDTLGFYHLFSPLCTPLVRLHYRQPCSSAHEHSKTIRIVFVFQTLSSSSSSAHNV